MTNYKHNNHKTPLPPRSNPDLWRALLLIFNHFQLHQELGRLRIPQAGQDAIPNQILTAIRVLDCWLDIALQEGWMEGE